MSNRKQPQLPPSESGGGWKKPPPPPAPPPRVDARVVVEHRHAESGHLSDMRFIVQGIEMNHGDQVLPHLVRSRVTLKRLDMAGDIESIEWAGHAMPPKPGTIVVVSMRIE